MNKKLIVTLLHKNIEELAMITASFQEQDSYSQAIIQLAIRKTEDIQTLLGELAAFQTQILQPAVDSVPVVMAEMDDIALENTDEVTVMETCDDDTIKAELNPIDSAKVFETVEVMEHNSNEPLLTNIHVDDLPDLTFAPSVPIVEDDLVAKVAQVDTEVNSVNSVETDQFKENNQDEVCVVEMGVADVSLTEEAMIILEHVIEQKFSESVADAVVEPLESAFEPQPEEPKKMTISEKLAMQTSSRNEAFAHSDNSLSASIANKKITDIKQAISIGDRFRFQRELFKSNGEDMNRTLTYLNLLATHDEALSFLKSKYAWDESTEAASDFYQLVKRKFA